MIYPADNPAVAELSGHGIRVRLMQELAEHVTEIDHVMTLPTPDLRPEREMAGPAICVQPGRGG